MMTISLSDAGKRFNRDWIFRHVNYTFTSGNAYAIVGPNGSGKSTLLQCIGGATAFSEGKIEVSDLSADRSETQKPTSIDDQSLYKHLSICAPYLELIEEMTATEFLSFHQTFKPLLDGWNEKKILEYVGLEKAAHKQIRYYSSGMKQRVKLAQAIFSNSHLLLLDEPCTNFDDAGYELYKRMISEFGNNRMIIVSSNDIEEYGFCTAKISINDYK